MRPPDALAAHRGELRELVIRHGLARARIFGSALTGTDDEENDLDLLVDPTATTSLLTLAAFKRAAETLLGVPVSVLTPNALPLKFRTEVLGGQLRYEASRITRRTLSKPSVRSAEGDPNAPPTCQFSKLSP